MKRDLWTAAGLVAVLAVGVVSTIPGTLGGAVPEPWGEMAGAEPVRAAAHPGGAAVTDSFPHLEHQGLFPLCEGCHQGIETDPDRLAMPEPSQCVNCHDGVERDEVDWTPAERPAGILDFSHTDHLASVRDDGEPAVRCAQCHVAEGGQSLEVVPLDAGRCLDCHGDSPDAHFLPGADCAQCHNTISEAWDGETRIHEMERPDEHRGRLFLLEGHGSEALSDVNRCATCHVEDQCASCHVDATLAPIPQVPPAPATWETPTLEAEYPEPDSHEPEAFIRDHGWPSPETAECSTCHTQDDCAACHLAPLPLSAESLQERPQVRAPGAGIADQLPPSHDTPFFLPSHPVLAAAGPSGCNSCHTQAYCAECHDAPVTPGYHPPSFVLRHSAPANTQVQECSNCHSVAAFCRECHTDLGMQSVGRLGQGFHDAEPVWLLRHGGAARQGLEQCASCHEQRDCLQCHSTLGAFSVSPHGPDFDPDLARARNPLICRACHVGGA